MGSEQNERNGLARRGDGATGFAHQYVIVDLDISAADLTARYAGTKRAAWIAEVIAGAVQRQRTKHPPSDAFTRGLRRARAIPPIVVVDLGRDGTKDGEERDPVSGRKRKAGKNHVLVIDGRQRCMSERENDRAREAEGSPPKRLDCDYFVPSKDRPREDVILFRVGSAVREVRTFSARAEDAADMMAQRYAPEDVAPYVEAKDAAEVAVLVALHGCCEKVKDAVDAGRLALAEVTTLAKLSWPEQERRVNRMTAAPKGANGKAAREARDAAAPPRPKARPRAHVLALAEHLERTFVARGTEPRYTDLDMATALRVAFGDGDALHAAGVSDGLRELLRGMGKPAVAKTREATE